MNENKKIKEIHLCRLFIKVYEIKNLNHQTKVRKKKVKKGEVKTLNKIEKLVYIL